MVHYSTVQDITCLKMDPRILYLNKNGYILYRKITIYGHFFLYNLYICIPSHMIVVGYYVFPFKGSFICLSAIGFRSLTWIVFDGFYSNFVYTFISGVSGFGLLMGKFRQCLTELSASHTSVFSFQDDLNIDICQTWYVHWYYGDLVGKFFVNYWQELTAHHAIVAGYYHCTFFYCMDTTLLG